ncbi:MAG: phosphoribosyltransferase domain-containing protein [Sphingomonadaceae bacterium]
MTNTDIHIPLTAGRLTIGVDRADWPLELLCDFAARDNPRRAFLVVSKVLGRHIPVAPSVMRKSFFDLAAKIPADLPGPLLIVGLAETAICLGQGVHEEYCCRTGRSDVLFLHSTRQEIDHPLLTRFEEPHSHASSHLVYRPDLLDGAFANPQSLVMIDDEISTGTTLVNLASATVAALPSIETIVGVTLADWSGTGEWLAKMPRPAQVGSLITGRLSFVADGVIAKGETQTFDQAARSLGQMSVHHNFGRLGRADVADECDYLATTIDLPPNARVRIICTGEFTYPPFRVAEALERAGHDVVVHSTTRSPAHLDGAIMSMLSFADNYQTGVPNFLYNVAADDPRVTLICHETPVGSLDQLLLSALQAQSLYFGAPG